MTRALKLAICATLIFHLNNFASDYSAQAKVAEKNSAMAPDLTIYPGQRINDWKLGVNASDKDGLPAYIRALSCKEKRQEFKIWTEFLSEYTVKIENLTITKKTPLETVTKYFGDCYWVTVELFPYLVCAKDRLAFTVKKDAIASIHTGEKVIRNRWERHGRSFLSSNDACGVETKQTKFHEAASKATSEDWLAWKKTFLKMCSKHRKTTKTKSSEIEAACFCQLRMVSIDTNDMETKFSDTNDDYLGRLKDLPQTKIRSLIEQNRKDSMMGLRGTYLSSFDLCPILPGVISPDSET